MSEINRENQGEVKQSLSNHQKFELVLDLFGSELARSRFVELCRQYNDIRLSQRAHEIIGNQENYRKSRKHDSSPPQRASIHNEIMMTLHHLALQKLNTVQQKALREIASRELAARIIHDYFEGIENSEDEEFRNPRAGSSETAYFHSLGKGE